MFKGFGVTQWEAPYQGEELLAWAKKIGLKTVSIEFDSKACTDDPSTEEWAIGWRKKLEKYGLEPSILAINVLCDIGMSRPERETDCMYSISLALKAARAMGAPAVHMPSFFDGWIYNREQLDQTIKCLKYACGLGERYGVKIGHEAVLPDEYYDIVLEELKGYEGTLYMLFDNENMSSRGIDPVPVYKKYAPKYIHAHLKHGRDGVPYPIVQDVRFGGVRNVLKAMDEQGFRGWIIFESSYKSARTPQEAEAILREDMAFVESVLKPE